MQAIASTSPNANSVRSHVVKYKKGEKSYRSDKLNIVQVTTAEYRSLHKAFNTGNSPELFAAFNDAKPTHKVDVDRLTLHTLDCPRVTADPETVRELNRVFSRMPDIEEGDSHIILVSIIDVNTTGLDFCKRCMS